jgi:hypothetical protein
MLLLLNVIECDNEVREEGTELLVTVTCTREVEISVSAIASRRSI